MVSRLFFLLAPGRTAAGVEASRLSRYWLFSADPTRYHWDTLFVKGKELWSDVGNSTAQRYLKQVQKGDKIICYHGPPERALYALATVASDPYPNPEEHSKKRSLVVDLKASERLPRRVPLKELKLNRALRRMRFLARPRLAVSPIREQEYNEILRMAGVPLSPFH